MKQSLNRGGIARLTELSKAARGLARATQAPVLQVWRRNAQSYPVLVVVTSMALLVGLVRSNASDPSRAIDPVRTGEYTIQALRPDLDPPDQVRTSSSTEYVVEPGDTLLSIASRFSSTVEAIRLASKLEDVHMLQVGQNLIVPAARSLLQPSDAPLTVRQLAEWYGVDARLLAEYNGMSGRIEEPYQRNLIVVPPSDGTLSAPDATAPRSAPNRSLGTVALSRTGTQDALVYTVAEGDTLSEIAEKLGVEPRTIMAANRIGNSDVITVGDSLRVPLWNRPAESLASASTGDGVVLTTASLGLTDILSAVRPTAPVTYEVAPGDTIGELAERFGVDPETIVNTNALRSADSIGVGDQLTILPVSGVLYSVQPGDTLEGIAEAFKVDLGPIIDFNYLDDADIITVGQEILIPGGRPLPPAPPRRSEPAVYIVSPGDTALSIARRFGVAVEDIVAANRLRSPDLLAVGDKLTIRPGAATAGQALGSQQSVTRNLAVPSASTNSVSSGPIASSGIGGSVVSVAMQYSGSRYVFGGTTPAGFDCSGFVYYVLGKAGKPISRGMWGQYGAGAHPSKSELQPGDMVFFQNTYMAGLSHNGIYVGGGQFIHASDERSGVKVSSLSDAYWSSRWFGATRL